jgi:PAN domain-containing protein
LSDLEPWMAFSIPGPFANPNRYDRRHCVLHRRRANLSAVFVQTLCRLCTLWVLLIGLVMPAVAQVGFDRPGGDYTNFAVRFGDPAACAARCDRDPRCRAWSFSYPTGATPNAVCWLKSEVTPWRPNPCCVSGVKGADVVGPRNPAIEVSIDRVGGDYRNVEVPPDPVGRTCGAACQSDARCRAWTYSRPGYYGGHAARCFLKDRVTLPRHDPCCISGVVR